MQRAIEELPGEVSLAFLAGTPDLPRWLQRARERGHESLSHAARRGSERPRRTRHPADPGLGRAGRESAPAARRDGARRGLCRLRDRLGRAGLAVGSGAASAGQGDRRSRPRRGRDQSDAGHGDRSIASPSSSARATRAAPTCSTTSWPSDGVAGNLDRLVAWVGETAPERPPRHAFGVMQPDDAGDRRHRGLVQAAAANGRPSRSCRSSAISNAATPAWRACAPSRRSSAHDAPAVPNSIAAMSA